LERDARYQHMASCEPAQSPSMLMCEEMRKE
jgi:hypothetical protein